MNGQVFPNIDLTARAPKHLWRIANMSAVVTYRLRLYDENGVWRKKAFKVVSVDGVLAGNSKPNSSPGDFELGRDEDELLLMPGARAEVVVSRQNEGVADKVWSLGTEGFTTGSGGDTWPKIILASVTMRGSPPTLEAGLAKPAQPPFFRVPVTITHSPLPPPANCIGLGDASYRRVRFWQPNAPFLIGPVLKKKGADDLTYVQAFRHEIPPGMQMHICARLGDVEIWALENDTDELHNFHIHQSKFRLASKQEMKRAGLSGSPVNDPTGLLDKSSPGLLAQYREEAESEGAVWHDSIPVPPRNGTELGSTVIVIPFKDPNQVGTFVYHCHILEHEDGGMMGVAEVYDPAAQRRAEVPATVREAGMGPPRSQFCGAAPANYSPIPLRASDAAIQVGWWDRIRRWSGGFL